MLHTVNKSPFNSTDLEDCLRYAQSGDSILLFQDAVYAAMAGTKVEASVKGAMGDKKVYALSADLKARGVVNTIDGIQTVDYGGFVDLTSADKVNCW